MTASAPPDPPPEPPRGLQALGLGRAHKALLAWPPDAHLVWAVLLALPVWIGLAVFAGQAMRAPLGTWAWLSLLLVQPLLEEMVFRGVLQGWALEALTHRGQPRRLGPITWANVLVTLAFVLLHLGAQPLAWALAVAAPSLVLGHLRERLGSVWPCAAVHAVYNAGFGLAAWLAHP